MHIGIDVHGVADLYPNIFSKLSKTLVDNGQEVSIVTGQEWHKVEPTIKKLGIAYTHHFSIVDHHLSIGTKMKKDERNTWWMDEKIWVRSKGDYLRRAHVDVHFDDSYEFAEYCPDFCTFILVPKTNFDAYINSSTQNRI